MDFLDPHRRYLYWWSSVGFCIFVTGVAIGLTAHGPIPIVIAVVFEALGAAILFPILVSYTYDRLRERWLGDEVWRLFGELSDAGIARIYKDREISSAQDNAQTRLAQEFRELESGEVRIMGVTLRVFFNPLGPFYADIESMLSNASGKVRVRALISNPESPEASYRAQVEEPFENIRSKSQLQRDAESTVAMVSRLCRQVGEQISIRLFMAAPYCTAVIFPHVVYFSPNILAPKAPVRLPMILYRFGSHGYRMLESSFEFLWNHHDTSEAPLSLSKD
jgi:hypothetical protein